jgi:hypothetical protein
MSETPMSALPLASDGRVSLQHDGAEMRALRRSWIASCLPAPIELAYQSQPLHLAHAFYDGVSGCTSSTPHTSTLPPSASATTWTQLIYPTFSSVIMAYLEFFSWLSI